MKSKLVIELIQAHCEKNEKSFEEVILNLSKDEEDKGNFLLAKSILKAYTNDKNSNSSFASSEISFSTQGIFGMSSFSTQNIFNMPKDKDSSLELLEIIQPQVKLNNVALPQNSKDIIQQIIKEQKKYDLLLENGIRPTNRILFCGPPGCGKTLTANAIAGELGLPIAYVKLDGLISSYLGQTGTNIRKIFDYVKNKRIILFLDEFDSIAKKRDDTNELGELKRVVTTLLQNMDFLPNHVLLFAATNHHHLLDPAIWRRFDISIFLDKPDANQREKIINDYISNKLNKHKINISELTTYTKGMSGSEIVTFLETLSKYCILNNVGTEIRTEDMAKIFLKHSILFSNEDSEEFINILNKMKSRGIPLRLLAKITGIPKSTIDYRINKEIKLKGG